MTLKKSQSKKIFYLISSFFIKGFVGTGSMFIFKNILDKLMTLEKY